MPSNVTLPASGAVVRTDDLTSSQVQAFKLLLGAAGSDGGFITESNPVPVRDAGATSAITAVTVTGTNQTLLSANAARRGGLIYFDGTSGYLRLGTSAASATDFSVKINAGDLFDLTGWSGQVTYLGSAASGTARVTEITA